jgi:hypothetical protein
MEVKQDPRIVLNAQDINEIFRTLGGKSIEMDDGRLVSFEIEMRHARNEDSVFANEMISHVLKDAGTDEVTEAIITAVRASDSQWTSNEVEGLVARLNEKFGTGLDSSDFMMQETFQKGSREEPWSREDVDDAVLDEVPTEEELEQELENLDGVEDAEVQDTDEEMDSIIDDALSEAEEEEEDEEPSMLDQFDPSDEVKQETAITLAQQMGFTDELSMEVADVLRQNGLLKENE